jgi:hypothetical protein
VILDLNVAKEFIGYLTFLIAVMPMGRLIPCVYTAVSTNQHEQVAQNMILFGELDGRQN